MMMRLAVVVAMVLATAAALDLPTTAPPPTKVGEQAVIGLSAGAFFAVQYHVAFSSELVGAGIVAGGPFYCAADELSYAITACMTQPEIISLPTVVKAAQNCEAGNVCDALSNLKDQKVWLFSGTKDTVVDSGVMYKLQEFYETFIPAQNVNTTFDVPAEHCWPTPAFGNPCANLGTPFISRCGIDASYEMLNLIFDGTLRQPAVANASDVYALSQDALVSGGSAATLSMGPNAYVYVPPQCANQAESCRLVTALHGCEQTIDDIGLEFVLHTEINNVAYANNMIVLYPQFIRSYISPSNPNGCADWWGYTGSDYSNKNGPQMQVVNKLVKQLL